MSNIFDFDAKIIKAPDMDACYIEIPFDIKELFGKGRVPVRACFDNVEYRGSIVRMGSPNYILGIRKDIRKQIGKGDGDQVHVQIEVLLDPLEGSPKDHK